MTTTIRTPRASSPDAPRKNPEPPRSFTAGQLVAALPGALRKLDPRSMWRNPVMFIVEVGAAVSTVLAIAQSFGLKDTSSSPTSLLFAWSIAIWLWLTVVFATLAESVAEGRGKAQASALRATRTSTIDPPRPTRPTRTARPGPWRASATRRGGSSA